MPQKHLDLKLQKAANGYDAQFVVSSTSPDRVGDTFTKAALQKLSRIPKLIALWQHKADQPCGYWERFSAKGDTLVANLKLADTNLGRMIRSLLDSGVPLGASVGFITKDAEPNKSGGIEIRDIDLMEISVVSTPANPQAVLLAKSFGFDESIFTDQKKSAPGQLDNGKSEALKTISNSLSRIDQCLQLQRK